MPNRDFASFLQERERASGAFVDGDIAALAAISTAHAPATLFGPKGDCVQGAEAVNAANAGAAQAFGPGGTNRLEILHQGASGELAYWVGVQRAQVRVEGKDEPVPFDLRVTEIFRWEEGGWKLVHRHADPLKQAS